MAGSFTVALRCLIDNGRIETDRQTHIAGGFTGLLRHLIDDGSLGLQTDTHTDRQIYTAGSFTAAS